ncbi:MAG: WG repeat-containing protein [Bacteroidota bacterium]
MKHIVLPALLLLSHIAFVQDDFGSIYRNAMNPYEGMTIEEEISFRNPFGKNYHSTEKYNLLEKKYEAFRMHMYAFDEDSVLFERKLATFELQEFKVGELTIKRYWLRQGNAIYTECYDSRQHLIATHQQDAAPYVLLELNKDLPSPYIVGEGLVLFSYSGDELKQGVKYFRSTSSMQYDFDIFEEKELPAPRALFERRDLENRSSPFFTKSEPHEGKLPELTPRDFFSFNCAHDHNCCTSGCSCCPDFSYLESPLRHQAIDPADLSDHNALVKTIQVDSLGRVVLTKNAGQEITLKALVLPHAPPLYQFSDTKGKVFASYTSTLTGEAFIAAYNGASEFYEYNENDEAWVVTTDGTFCKINKSGKQISFTLSDEELNTLDYEPLSDSLYAVRFTIHEHLPYHIGNYTEEKFETIALVGSKGKLIRYTKYSSLEPFGKGLYLAGEEAFQFTHNPGRQKKTYSLLDRSLQVLTPVPYELIDPPGDGLMRVKTEKGFGFIDMAGKEVIPCQYFGATVFENGRAYVILGDEEYYINKSGKRCK